MAAIVKTSFEHLYLKQNRKMKQEFRKVRRKLENGNNFIVLVLVILFYVRQRTNREKEKTVCEMIYQTSPSKPFKDFETLTMSKSALLDQNIQHTYTK